MTRAKVLLTVESKEGKKESIETNVAYLYGVFETSFDIIKNKEETFFEGWSKSLLSAEKKASSSKDVNKVLVKMGESKRYTNIRKEIVEVSRI